MNTQAEHREGSEPQSLLGEQQDRVRQDSSTYGFRHLFHIYISSMSVCIKADVCMCAGMSMFMHVETFG